MYKYIALIMLSLLVACSNEPDDYDGAGNSIRSEDYEGRYLLINYWAEWCHPCLAEIPELNLLAEEYKEDILVIGVNFDGLLAEELLLQQERLGIRFRVVTSDPVTQFGYEPPEVLPTSYLFDPEQKLIATLVGPQTRESIISLIEPPS